MALKKLSSSGQNGSGNELQRQLSRVLTRNTLYRYIIQVTEIQFGRSKSKKDNRLLLLVSCFVVSRWPKTMDNTGIKLCFHGECGKRDSHMNICCFFFCMFFFF